MSEDLGCRTSSLPDFEDHWPHYLNNIQLSFMSPLDPAKYSDGTALWQTSLEKCIFLQLPGTSQGQWCSAGCHKPMPGHGLSNPCLNAL